MERQPSMRPEDVQQTKNPIDLIEPVENHDKAALRNTFPSATTGAGAKREPEPEND